MGIGLSMGKSITQYLLAFSLAALCCLPASAQQRSAQAADLQLQESAPDRYIVERGDTLWSIARKFLKEPWRWQEIWRLNQDQIRNPHRIYPGDVIVLNRQATPPQLSVLNTIKLSPQVRVEPAEADAIPSIPANVIEPFLNEALVIEVDGLARAPRIIATQESHVNLGPGGLAYVTGLGASPQGSWQVYRPGRALVDPDSQRTLGYEATYLGTARLTRSGDPATMTITTAKQEISSGDRLVALGAPAIVQYAPRAPAKDVRGRVIGIVGGLPTSEGGRNQVVSLNRGKRDGLETGHVLGIFRAGARVPDPASPLSRDQAPTFQLPEERYGLVFVFRTFESVSYALIMESSRPVTPGDAVGAP
jgi:hypothetical protein